MTKLDLWQNSNCDKTWIVTKLKLWQNWKCEEKTQMWQNSIATKLENSNDVKTQKLKWWQNSKTQIMTKLEIWQISISEEKQLWKDISVLKNWHVDVGEMFSGQRFVIIAMLFVYSNMLRLKMCTKGQFAGTEVCHWTLLAYSNVFKKIIFNLLFLMTKDRPLQAEINKYWVHF